MVRVYFATDVHGSDLVWRKWLSVPAVHKADVLILAGDLTGKAICPIVRQSDGSHISNVFGRNWKMNNETELNEMKERVARVGYYPFVCDQREFMDYQQNPKKIDKLMLDLISQRIASWLELLVANVDLKEKKAIVMPGNDDEKGIDPIIKSYEDRGIIYPLEKAVNLCYDFEMISLDYANPTPWNTPRECSEGELKNKIDDLFRMVKDYSKTICNFHCPPSGTRLDLARKLDKNLKPVLILGNPVFIHVGSKSVEDAIRKYQPMMGLHGHIHESFASDKIGNTIVVNPGSEYTEALLRGFIIDFSERGVDKYWKVEG